jgi:hypothetical protein
LENAAPPTDLSRLTPTLMDLVNELDDEFSPAPPDLEPADEVTVTLTYPHMRMGTLPLSPRLAHLFPTAFEAPRVRFTLVDGDTDEALPAWVVRSGKYVFGLAEWYQKHDFPAGGHLVVQRGSQPGQVVIRAHKRRPTREWVRTAAEGPDGRVAFSMQKQLIGVEYDDLMMVAPGNQEQVDAAWERCRNLPFAQIVADVFRELAKLNPQSAVHAKTLYAGVNVARRSPPGPIFAELVAHPYYALVGDAYWRFDQTQWTE